MSEAAGPWLVADCSGRCLLAPPLCIQDVLAGLEDKGFFAAVFPNVGDTRVTVFDDAVNICGRASTNDRFLGR